MTNYIQAIERVLDKRLKRGASDASLISYLTNLKINAWKDCPSVCKCIDGFIDAIKQTPIK
jgi:hypothetical protein